MRITKTLRAIIAVVSLWATPAILPVTIGAAVGFADITVFHGCIGVEMSNWFPWTSRYVCEPAPVAARLVNN